MRQALKKFAFALLPVTCFFTIANGQLCTGSLGDPVVKITFGSGANPGSPLAAATTTYQYVTDQCPNDGYYTVANSTSGCFGNSWFSVPNDHTGNPNGYFMLVNASFQPGDFYVDNVKALCPNTTYEFAAWILNVLAPFACGGNGIRPNITFSIETSSGTVLKSYNTGDIAGTNSPAWNQYGFYFTTPADVSSIVLRMRNNAPGGCGNDLALDDITFRPCGPLATANFSGIAADTTGVCQYDNTIFTLNASVSKGYIAPSYQWQVSTDTGTSWNDIPGANTTVYVRNPTTPGYYQYRMNVADGNNIMISSCRISSNPLTVIVSPKPIPAATANSPLCDGDSLSLTASTGSVYIWSGPDNFSSTVNSNATSPSTIYIPNASAANSGKYYVTVTNSGGCAGNDSVSVAVNPNPIANVSANATICKGSSTILNAGGGVAYLWSPSSGLSANNIPDPQASPDTATAYLVKVYNQYHCFDTASVSVSVLITPIANAGPDKKIMEGQSVVLNGSTNTPDATYSWSPLSTIDDPSILQPTVMPDHDITYTLKLSSTIGCGVSTDDVFVRVLEKITIPNAFSPNGDGINDVWNIKKLITYPESQTQVFNRYGQVVFEANGYEQAWDGKYNGKPVPGGTYYYLIDLKNNLPKLSGWVFIVY